jgi:hypothetical protein
VETDIKKIEEGGGLNDGVELLAEEIYKGVIKNIKFAIPRMRIQLMKIVEDFIDSGDKPQEPHYFKIGTGIDPKLIQKYIQGNGFVLNFEFNIVKEDDPQVKDSPINTSGAGVGKTKNGETLISISFVFSEHLLYLDNNQFLAALQKKLGRRLITMFVHELTHELENNNIKNKHGVDRVSTKSYYTLAQLDKFANDMSEDPSGNIFSLVSDHMYKTSEIEERAMVAEVAYTIRTTSGITKERMFEIVKKSRMNLVIESLQKDTSSVISHFIKQEYKEILDVEMEAGAYDNNPQALKYQHAKQNHNNTALDDVINKEAGEFLHEFISKMMVNIDKAFDKTIQGTKVLNDQEFKAYKKIFMNKTADKISDGISKHIQKRVGIMKKKLYKVAAINYYQSIKRDPNQKNIEKSNLAFGKTNFSAVNNHKP